ncbi:Peroxisomal membrane protein PMP22 [Tripterygium wilfordii]|uniref:Peroxisomal membrane protein PMP22 n=1 Tax=Tripterygium wilfordii TaxID=458696 RepID=A0A7J7C4M6_TRIWF|nr:peroxisomal membrane protein PMP22-like [Tripterygium wilfordii]KAF5729074.1 Peroxisomal membrane protein PMP22 [Tripterygium wilfordii]
MGSIAKQGMKKFMLQLQQHPLRTKAIMAAAVSAISDIVSQKLSGIQKLQLRRVLLKVILGFAYLGPFGHFLHMQLEKIFKGKKDTKTVAKKVFVEQITSAPLNNLLFMIYLGAVIERRPWMDVKAKIKKEYPTVMVTSWTFWPVVGFINHMYMPLQFRVVFQIFVSFFWGIFLNLRAKSTRLTNSGKAK